MPGKKNRPTDNRTARSKNQPPSNRPKSGGAKRPSTSRSGETPIVSKVSSTSSKPSSQPSYRPKQAVNKPATPASTMPATPQANTQAARLSSAQARWQRVAGTVALAALFDHLEDLTSRVGSLDNEINDVRARGYRFGRGWEETAAMLKTRWPQQRQEANRMLLTQRTLLQTAANDVQRLIGQAERNFGLLDTVDNRLWSLENQVNEAQRNVNGLFDSTEQEINTLMGDIRRAKSLLDALDSASFDLQPDEHGIAVCEAQWVSDHQQPEGMFFLTNNRVIFEQREEQVTKKVLFIATEKQLIQNLLWDAPVGAVTELEAEDKKGGFLGIGRQELLTLRFPERTRELPSDVILHLKGGATNEAWRTLIRQTKSGQIQAEMFGAPTPQEQLAAQVEAEAEAPAELPTRCPACNATLPPIYKGMQQVECAYCGTVINI